MWALSSGGWTPHLNSIRTWKATQVLSWLLVKGPCTLHPCDQSWMAEAWQRQNLLAWVMLCPRCYGHKISWSHKGTQSRNQLFTKTTKVLSFSRKMDGPPVANKPNTSTFAISLSLTTSKVERCLSIIAPLGKCWLISSPSLFRVLHSTYFGTILWALIVGDR